MSRCETAHWKRERDPKKNPQKKAEKENPPQKKQKIIIMP
jgi:hypothetical protein